MSALNARAGSRVAGPSGRDRPRPRAWHVLAGVLLGLVPGALVVLWVSADPAPGQLPPLPSVAAAEPALFHPLLVMRPVASPLGVAVSPDGLKVYVTEGTGEREVVLFLADGTRAGSLAPPDTRPAERGPAYAAVRPDGSLLVSDAIRRTVDVYSPAATYQGTFNPAGDLARDWAPLAVAAAPDGRIAVSDVSRQPHRVLVFGSGGDWQQSLSGPDGGPELRYPTGLAFLPDGGLLVADSNNGRLLRFDRQGNLEANSDETGLPLGLPRAPAVLADGTMLVAEPLLHAVAVLRQEGSRFGLVSRFGESGGLPGQFQYPNAVAVGPAGRVYVADRENNRVSVWTR